MKRSPQPLSRTPLRLLLAAWLLVTAGTAIDAHAATGACCETDGSCNEGSVAACGASGGAFQGDGSTCATHCPEPTGTQFTFQGALSTGNGPVGGMIDLAASLWDAPIDGVQVASTQIVSNVNLDTGGGQGLFTVQLDFGAEVFNAEARWVQIAVRHPAGSGQDFSTISPRQPIRAVPYAIQTRGIFVDDAYRVGIGTTTPQFRLDVRSTAPRAIYGWVTNPTGDTHGVFGQSASSQGKGVTGFASADSGETLGVYGLSSSPAGRGVYGLATANSGTNYGVWGQSYSPDGEGVYGEGKKYGVHGFTDGLARTGSEAGVYGSSAASAGLGFGVVGTCEDCRAAVRGRSTGSAWGVLAEGNDAAAAALRAQNFGGGPAVETLGDADILGRLGVGTSSPLRSLHVVDNPVGLQDSYMQGEVAVIEDNDAFLGLYSNAGGDWGSGIVFGEVNEGAGAYTNKWAIVRRTTGSGGGLQFRFSPDVEYASANSVNALTLRTDGTASVQVLEIRGADVAEKFPASEELQPGLVAAIDPANPGKFCLARGAYNRGVAGVVSGANNFSAGAVLGNLPGHENAPPIALSGRVYVWCDATEHAIEPTDLLTSSDTPGHAMKVIDYAKAQGAILGKAMTSLAKGEKGLVLVLVNLQ